MMKHLHILNSKEIKLFQQKINKRWGCMFPKEYAFLRNNKNKIYMISRALGKVEYENLRIDAAGLYIAEELKDDNVRLSIDGSQIIGRNAEKNVVEISSKAIGEWLRGNDVQCDDAIKGFVILKNEGYICGCGNANEGIIRNFVPKTRRILSKD